MGSVYCGRVWGVARWRRRNVTKFDGLPNLTKHRLIALRYAQDQEVHAG